MPELPEVETIRLQLNQVLKGLKITDIEILSPKNFIGDKKEVIGEKVEKVERRAKIILINLAHNKCLAIHLKMTGQLIFNPKLPDKYTRVVIYFNKGRLYFNDLRKFGWMKVVNGDLEKFGPEAIDEKSFTLEYLKNILSKSKKPIKLMIMDQEKLAGVGNIYANEALFLAKIRPDRVAQKLSDQEIKILRKSIIQVLRQALKNKGTTDRDDAYRQITGERGNFQNYLKVYGRQDQKCPKCSGLIKRIKLGGRGTFFCQNCQK